MLEIIPKPKTQTWKIINIVIGMVAIILALFYIFSSLDLVPDATPVIGWIDDIIILILALFFANKFWQRISNRWQKNKAVYSKMWSKGDFIKIFTSARFWIAIIIIGLIIAYFIWVLDLIPDGLQGLGYADDTIFAIGALIALIRFYWSERK